jgi:hypothetical protein
MGDGEAEIVAWPTGVYPVGESVWEGALLESVDVQ